MVSQLRASLGRNDLGPSRVVTTLAQLLSHLIVLDDDDTLFASQPWTPEGDAATFTDEIGGC